MKAIWNGVILAESDKTIMVEGTHYFPPEAIKKEFFHPSQTKTRCGWKGEASYYSVTINDTANMDCAWYYPQPKPAAQNIKDYVAFWNGVKVTK
ncbi:MAG: DUF427 domain-containing protein [Thaumarchaeota archaeon]|nr:DUF427 domain-containing protein [Nitrososphaerota archaeon]